VADPAERRSPECAERRHYSSQIAEVGIGALRKGCTEAVEGRWLDARPLSRRFGGNRAPVEREAHRGRWKVLAEGRDADYSRVEQSRRDHVERTAGRRRIRSGSISPPKGP